MLRAGKTELICDLAETYGVLDYRALPVETLAALCVGLREDSRIKRKIAGERPDAPDPNLLMLATIADGVSRLVWMQTKDGAQGRNIPKSLVAALLKTPSKDNEVASFDSASDFESEWERITGTEHVDNSTSIRPNRPVS